MRGVRQELALHAIDFALAGDVAQMQDLRDVAGRRRQHVDLDNPAGRRPQLDHIVALACIGAGWRIAGSRRT